VPTDRGGIYNYHPQVCRSVVHSRKASAPLYVSGFWAGLYLWVISGDFWGHPLDELCLNYEYAYAF